jgi:D-glycero-D-manno-heptose 1,7-bisphosphate phosphatase
VVIVTNQSGIGRAYYSEETFLSLTQWMVESIAQQGAFIHKVYFCPHHPEHAKAPYNIDCTCRKPKTGMAINAQRDFSLDLNQSIMVGDKRSDVEFAINAHIGSAFWLKGEEGVTTPPYTDSQTRITEITSLDDILAFS